MKTTEPKTIVGSNLSTVWARTFLDVLNGGDSECLIVAIRDFDGDLPPQDEAIINQLNEALRNADIPTTDQTALALIPYQRWLRMGKPDLQVITQWYLNQLLPRLKARCSRNRRGTYFERMVAYTGVRFADGKPEVRSVNQLEYVLSFWRKRIEKGSRPRQSALQLSCFDPAKDDTGAVLSGFPCLQQISLTYHEAGTLEVNAYYPTQYIFDRAYGNYLGLCQLGHFLAHQLGVRFSAFTCFVARPELGYGSQASHGKLVKVLRERLGVIAPPTQPPKASAVSFG
jgi:hypothetical protein